MLIFEIIEVENPPISRLNIESETMNLRALPKYYYELYIAYKLVLIIISISCSLKSNWNLWAFKLENLWISGNYQYELSIIICLWIWNCILGVYWILFNSIFANWRLALCLFMDTFKLVHTLALELRLITNFNKLLVTWKVLVSDFISKIKM